MAPQSLERILTTIAELPARAIVVGVDEVGRGCLFGPVVAGAIAVQVEHLPQWYDLGLKDSKALSPHRRWALIEQFQPLPHWQGLGEISSTEIDRINILQAALQAMKGAIADLGVTPALCLIDGNKLVPNLPYPQMSLVKGDQLHPLISAASIVAKVNRDRTIEALAESYSPLYDLKSNKGYGTVKHRQAIAQLGITPHHRQSFRPCQNVQPNPH
jgi:ribonuclease HII